MSADRESTTALVGDVTLGDHIMVRLDGSDHVGIITATQRIGTGRHAVVRVMLTGGRLFDVSPTASVMVF